MDIDTENGIFQNERTIITLKLQTFAK
jgi:hypothetical protein